MPPKPPCWISERILETALAMFNKLGEPSVATSVAFEAGISPDNLYYHYHTKEAIVADLFAKFGARSKRRWLRRSRKGVRLRLGVIGCA